MKYQKGILNTILCLISFYFFNLIYLDFIMSMMSIISSKNPFYLFLAMGQNPHPLDFDFVVYYFDNNENAINVPALESSSSSESLATFRAQIAAGNENEIYERIQALEAQNYYNLPPQNNNGEYERQVRENFDQAISVNHFREIYDREYLELRVLERKGILQNKLVDLMLREQQIDKIMEISPYTNIGEEAYSFIQDKVDPVSSLRHAFQRDIMDGSLNSFVQDLNQNDRNAEIYREFYSHFIDEEFRRKNGLPLP